MKTFNIKTILVPTDFSETAGNALRQAIQIAKMNKAEITLLHIVTPFDITYQKQKPSDKFDHHSLYNKVVKAAENELKKIAKEITEKNSIKVECIVKVELVIEDVICNVAEKEKTDLIVMGTHGTAGAREFFAGKNTYLVVHHAECPVLTIPKRTSKQGLKNIILPIRLESNSRQKVDYAVQIARLFDSTVFITGYTDDTNKSKQNKVKQYVAQVENYLSALGIKNKSTSIFSENFTKETLDYAKKNKADLIVVMKKHDFSLNQLVKGTYSEQFVNHSEIPVLSVPVYSNPDMIENFSLLVGDVPY
jgi:nucleotide-binding universal stress UspA family protein